MKSGAGGWRLPRRIGCRSTPTERKQLVMRTHGAGTLRAEHAGTTLTLTGWVARRRDHGGVAFLDLRDASGVVQVVVRDEMLVASGAHDLRNEYCILVTGEVALRPEGNANTELPTGEIEVVVAELEVLSASAPLPFQIDERVNVGEETRLKYRYLDLRRPGRPRRSGCGVRSIASPYAALRARLRRDRDTDLDSFHSRGRARFSGSGAAQARLLVRAAAKPATVQAAAHGGRYGALLPDRPLLPRRGLPGRSATRIHPARCRDELRQPGRRDRADRGADHRHLAAHRCGGRHPLLRLTYADAMNRFGTDKPDLRFGQELVELTDYFAETPFRVFQADYVGAVVMPGGASQPRKQLDAWQEFARQRGHRGLAYVLVGESGELGGPVAKNLSESERSGLLRGRCRAGGLHLLCGRSTRPGAVAARSHSAGDWPASGAHRRERLGVLLGGRCSCLSRRMSRWQRATSPSEQAPGLPYTMRSRRRRIWKPSTRSRLSARLRVRHRLQWQRDRRRLHPYPSPRHPRAGVRGDGVVEGGGAGEVRLPTRRVQLRPAPARGIAFGWDRICALLSGTDSIRDVIAFPKTGGGVDPLTDAPAPITPNSARRLVSMSNRRSDAGLESRCTFLIAKLPG